VKRRDPFPARAPSYVALYPSLVQIARDHGYALAAHGSLHRDFDLVAIPWVDDAADALTLFKAIRDFTQTCTHDFDRDDEFYPDGNPTKKPHGRVAYSLHFTADGGFGAYIDLSILPRTECPVNTP
jgi:hypothetical protein